MHTMPKPKLTSYISVPNILSFKCQALLQPNNLFFLLLKMQKINNMPKTTKLIQLVTQINNFIKKIKQICPQSFQIQSDPIQRKQLLKIINRSKIEVEEEIIMEEEDESEEEGQEIITTQKITIGEMTKKLNELQQAKKNKEYTDIQIEEINKKFQSLKLNQNQQKQGFKEISNGKNDHIFQQYKKTMKTLNDPVLVYSNIPIPYNKTPLNPKHTCKHCNMKLQLQIQLTQKILLIHKSLAILDWGSIFVYVCTGSCSKSQQQCVVVQYELDAISEQEVTKIKKTKKNRKKNKNKSLSKEKKKLQEIGKIKPEIVKNIKQQETEQKQEDEDQGDWD